MSTLNPHGNYCMYLRKSRKDLDLEKLHPGETLAKHQKILADYATLLGIHIQHIYKEIVSGETISSRPEMQQLLDDVSANRWDGVLVVEVERLARGDTSDQGQVSKAFKYSNTKIITPSKIYDPQNEFDEEYLEFGLFMSRREYKTISRRMQTGRELSAKMGKYIGHIPPYGYDRISITSTTGFTLTPNTEQAAAIKFMYDSYIGNNCIPIGSALIAKALNDMDYPLPKSGRWTVPTIISTIRNPVYMGKIVWKSRGAVKKMVDGELITSRPRTPLDELNLYDGLHPAIISEHDWWEANYKMDRNPSKNASKDKPLQNPFAGLIKCGNCGRAIGRHISRGKVYVECREQSCKTVRSYMKFVERDFLKIISSWLQEFEQDEKNTNIDILHSEIQSHKKSIEKTEKNIEDAKTKLNNLYDFFEKGYYEPELFFQRKKLHTTQISELTLELETMHQELNKLKERQKNFVELIPNIKILLDTWELSTPATQNQMAKEVVEKIVYTKSVSGKDNHEQADKFNLTVYPRL